MVRKTMVNCFHTRLPLVGRRPVCSRARVVVDDATRTETRRVAVGLFGRLLRSPEYADLAGAPDDAVVRVRPLRGMLQLEMVQAARYGYCGAHLVLGDRPETVLVCGGYRILDRRLYGQRLTLGMCHRQLTAASSLGIQTVLASADRGPGEDGYYRWPRLGFDAALPRAIVRSLPRALRRARRLLDLMQSQAGREWWRRHGIGLNVAFDLRPGSHCWRVFLRNLAGTIDLRPVKASASSRGGCSTRARGRHDPGARVGRRCQKVTCGDRRP